MYVYIYINVIHGPFFKKNHVLMFIYFFPYFCDLLILSSILYVYKYIYLAIHFIYAYV